MNLMLLNGLGGLYNSLTQNWIGPAFLIGIAALSLYFIKNRQFRELAGFVAIAAVVALLIFSGEYFFGSSGKLTNSAKTLVDSVNTIGINAQVIKSLI